MIAIKLLLFSAVTLAASPTAKPPKVFIDKGACPFECCTYREWTVTQDTTLYSAIKRKERIGTAKAKTRVTGLTGEVHVVPTKIVIKKSHGEYKPGDIIYLLTYEGEGSYKVWDKGEIFSDNEVYQLFEDVSPNLRADWGEPKSKPKSTWWVKIKLSNGKEGWTKDAQNFGDMDACG